MLNKNFIAVVDVGIDKSSSEPHFRGRHLDICAKTQYFSLF